MFATGQRVHQSVMLTNETLLADESTCQLSVVDSTHDSGAIRRESKTAQIVRGFFFVHRENRTRILLCHPLFGVFGQIVGGGRSVWDFSLFLGLSAGHL
ncbi:hypothetical protein CIW51_05155 [Mycolicibacterium sp. P9-22]|nr:hypothetical protein CIW51_05155 [Mycolicibacterium sp. P9-22]